MARELIAQNHLEIGRADGKATVLLATAGSLLALLLPRGPLGASSWHDLLWWTATVSTTVALLFLLLALLPRQGRPRRGRAQHGRAQRRRHVLAYYEDVVRAERRAELTAGLREGSADPRPRLARALADTSGIARTKNRWIRHAVRMLLPAIAVLGFALVTGSAGPD
ncbi:Pycsar system effector family protein [Streptomyces oceani]|uniref:Pycsar effector protein domain-containing protein n=1 Tax=Streptomyces oceani TaxID=1075402 RepID=A0A1E7JW55_9ACTN|nr:Pycsar system effector family protein [Streptomyces oceani]OEU95753.1 hypothetical protein AN216_23215 [Streptomyces oceani]